MSKIIFDVCVELKSSTALN